MKCAWALFELIEIIWLNKLIGLNSLEAGRLFLEHGFTQRGKVATKQAFSPQISQITQILQIINKNNPKSIGFHDLPSKN